MSTPLEVFTESLIRRKAEREAKKYIAAFCQGMPPEEFSYAADNNLNIALPLLKMLLLKPGEEKAGRKKAQRYRPLVEKLVNAEALVRLFSEVSPEHGKILDQHRSWVERQLRLAFAEVFES